MKTVAIAEIGDWTFWEATSHGWSIDGPVYTFTSRKEKEPKNREWFNSLDRAIVAAIGEKYTGPRGAGGAGVGTAADWFCRMIGMDQLVEPDYEQGQKAIREALAETANVGSNRARHIADRLEARGMFLAAKVGS